MDSAIHRLKTGEQVVIRTVRLEDASAVLKSMQQMAGESEFLSEGAGGYNLTLEEQATFIQRHLDHHHAFFVVAQMEDEIVGVLTFAPGDKKRTAHWGEFGMSIRQIYWGQGIGKKLLGLLIKWARANPHLDRIMLNVDANNLRGRSLYQKLGFLEEGLQHKAIKFTDGRYSDNVLMAMWVGE